MLIIYPGKDTKKADAYQLGIQERVLNGDKHSVIISIEFVFKVIRLNDITKDECVFREER